MNKTFGFIGTGNMGGTLARAVSKAIGGHNILLCDRDIDKAVTLSKEIGANIADLKTVALESSYIFLGVKPQILPSVLEELSPWLSERPTTPILVSMAAGISISAITSALACEYPVIRIMPNTPAGVGEGMILCCSNSAVTDDMLGEFKNAMSKAGKTDIITEQLIDAAGCVSGCGPAFAYMFIQSLADGGVECGMPRDKALLYAAQTVLGAAKTVLSSGKHPDLLKDEVCSPGGTTIVGVHALEDGALRSTVMDAVTSAYYKTLELKK